MIMILKNRDIRSCVSHPGSFAGGLLTGWGAVSHPGCRQRECASMMQPFRDVKNCAKNLRGRSVFARLLCTGVCVFEIVAGVAFFAGANLLFVILALLAADVFLVVAAYVSNSVHAHMGADYELMRMMAYCPMVLFMAAGFSMYCGSMEVRDIMIGSSMPFLPLIGDLCRIPC